MSHRRPRIENKNKTSNFLLAKVMNATQFEQLNWMKEIGLELTYWMIRVQRLKDVVNRLHFGLFCQTGPVCFRLDLL